MVTKYVRAFGENSQVICPIQFYSTKGNLDRNPKNLPGKDSSFKNCKWLGVSAFQKTKPIKVYSHILTHIGNIIISKTDKRMIPLSVCPCTDSINYNCYTPNLGSPFPGQTLNIKFIVSEQWIYEPYFGTTLVVANTWDDDCSVVDIYSHQLSQTHFNHDCNTYEYTIWPSHEFIIECTLFLV